MGKLIKIVTGLFTTKYVNRKPLINTIVSLSSKGNNSNDPKHESFKLYINFLSGYIFHFFDYMYINNMFSIIFNVFFLFSNDNAYLLMYN